MGIILGYVCVLLFGLLAIKALSKRLHFTSVDRIFMRIHKPVCILLVLAGVLHLFMVIPVLCNRNIFVIISGIVIFLVMLVQIFLFHKGRCKSKRLFWHRALTVFLIIGIVSHMISYMIDFNNYQQKIDAIAFSNIDVTTIADGTYEGAYDAGYIYAKVAVEIKAGKITSISLLEHKNERGKAAERITDDMLTQNQITVDAVTGATNSSNVIKKAVENAVTSAR